MSGQSLVHTHYKESGVDWIGAVPEHWQLLPARVSVTNLAEKNEGAKNQNYLSLVAGKGVIPYADKGDMGNKKPDDLSKCKIVRKGNIVINSMNFFIGSYGMSEYEGVCSPVYIVLDVNQSAMERRFALRVFGDTGFQLYLATFGDGILKHRAAIGWDDIKGAYLPIPPLTEQTQIAKFLDYETAKIDALIEKQQQLIALLKEKRQAVISHAVTKGLNPDAPMRDSGVEWLGEVPAHWEVAALKQFVSTVNGFGFSSSDFRDEGVPFIRAGNIKNKSIRTPTIFLPENVVAKYERVRLVGGDIVISMVGSDPKIIESAVGQVGIVPESLVGAVPNQNVVIMRENKQCLISRFLFYTLCCTPYRNHLNVFSHKLANQSIISSSLLVAAKFVFPIKQEQQEIVNFLDKQIEVLNELLIKTGQAVELLQERRTALISAAVTGKIDVRNWNAPETKVEKEVA